MANKKYVNNFQDLLKFINNTFDTQFDTEKSSFRQGYIQFTGDKYGFTVSTTSGMFNKLIECGIPLKVNQSLRSGTGFMLEFLDSFSLEDVTPKDTPSIEEAVEATQDGLDEVLSKTEEVVITEEEPLPVVEDTSIEEETPEEETQSLEDCLEEAQNLYDSKDKRGSKAALEKYGRDFNIELNRGNTFENMMKEFEEALVDKFGE